MPNLDQQIHNFTQEYALYPIKEVKRLYQCAEHYAILSEKIKYLETENRQLKQKILQLTNHL